MIESTQKKATFLKEAIGALELRGATVFADRAESYPVESRDLVTLRAVERFDSALVVAAGLVADRGRIALLIGKPQLENLSSLTPPFSWAESLAVHCRPLVFFKLEFETELYRTEPQLSQGQPRGYRGGIKVLTSGT